MKKDTSFVEYIMYDVLGHIEGLTSRGMFSGYGIYKDGAIIALIIDGELYFKTDNKLKARYVKKGYKTFQYDRKGKMVELNYVNVTAEDLEDKDEMSRRAEESYELSAKSSA